jgi:ABC-type lipoprotein export system ATPase subunit
MLRTTSEHTKIESAVFRIRNIGRRLGEKSVWIDTLDIPRGKVVAIIGASGSGKSSLLHIVGGLSPADYKQEKNFAGLPMQEPALEATFRSNREQVSYDLLKTPPPHEFQSRVGFVFQSPYLLQSATASANVALGAYSSGCWIGPEAVQQIAESVSIDPGFLAKRTNARSGGERQRIALARAFARAPNLILADEPTASLDPRLAEEIIGHLRRWSDPATDRTIIWVTHDVHLAARFSDTVVVMREGRLAEGATWPQENPGEPSILRGWIDGGALAGCVTPPSSVAKPRELESPAVRPAVPKSVRAEAASGWSKCAFWMKIGVAQVFDGLGADRIELLKKWTSVDVAQASTASPAGEEDRKGKSSVALQLFKCFNARGTVVRLALFVTLMIVLWAELDGLTWNIRSSLLSPTLNPVVISSRATINDSAVGEARQMLAIQHAALPVLPDAFGRYEFGSRRVARLRDNPAPAKQGNRCANPQNRWDKEILMDVAGLDPGEPLLGRLSPAGNPNSPPTAPRTLDRAADDMWSIWLSGHAQEKLVGVLGAAQETKLFCIELRGVWIDAELTGTFTEAARGRFGPYDVIMSAAQWRDFGVVRDRDYYQSVAVYFEADPAQSRELVEVVRARAREISDPPNTRLVQSLANEAAFERISAALERSMFSQIIVGFLGVVSLAVLVLVIWSYISENFQSNLKSICVALAFGAGFREIATIQVTRSALIVIPASILSGLSVLGYAQYQLRFSSDPASRIIWDLPHLLERSGSSLLLFVAGTILLTLVFSRLWLGYIRRRSLTDQLKELD